LKREGDSLMLSKRDLCKTPPFAQFLCQAQILILKILNVFLWLKFSPSLNLNKIEHFSKVSKRETARFIRCISKTHLSQADMDHMLHFLQKDVHWDYLRALAEMEGVAGLLYYHLKALDLLDYLPKSFIERLGNTYNQTKRHTLAILSKVEALASKLEGAHIPVLALQGLSLVSIYKNPGLRPLGDADLMVKANHKGKLKSILWGTGYRMPSFMYPDLLCQDGIWVDIHTHILNLERIRSRQYLFPEDLAPMWVRAIPFFDKSGGLLLLDPYDNFIALAAHALKHSYSRLIWLVDLYESLLKWAGNTGGWEGMIDRAYFWQQEKVVLYALILMERILDLKVPLWVKDYLGIRKLNILEKQVIRMKLKGFSSGELCYVLWLFNIKGIKRKLKFFKETLFPKDKIMNQIFPHKSGTNKGLIYLRRIINMIIILWRNLRQALIFSFRAGGGI